MSTPKTRAVLFVAWPETVEFVDDAAKKAGISRGEYIRQSVEACAEVDLKRKAPKVRPIVRGRRDEITDAAKEAGLSRTQYRRREGEKALAGK
jgi:hypothetical protein